jgi:DNA-binding transcriptional ArsR family regulator
MAYTDALEALGDPTRRAIFERLHRGPSAVGELAREFPVSRPAVSQHLRVLKRAGLVRDTAAGTRRLYQVDADGLAALRAYLESFWDRSLSDFRSAAEREEEQMTTQTTIEPIVRSVVVRCPLERAFELYTARLGEWWPLETHSIAAMRGGRPRTAVIEPRAGGRMYEVMDDGAEAPWGEVTAWDPPHRLGIAWHVNPEAPAATEIEVRFTPQDGGTRVEVEHRGWERLGPDRGAAARAEYAAAGGWLAVLGRYEAAAGG